jgi:hypothetical protein
MKTIMHLNKFRVTGVGLLIVGLLILCLSPNSESVFVILGFAGCTVAGLQLIFFAGYLSPKGIQQQREEAVVRIKRGGWKPLTIPPRSYRYHVSRFNYGVVLLMGVGFIVLGIGVFFIGDHISPLSFAVAGFFLVFGGLSFLYVYRHSHIHIDIHSRGIKAQTLFGNVQFPWHEVVEFRKSGIRQIGIGQTGEVYKVYSLHRSVEFYGTLEGAKDLAASIDFAIDRTWQ